MRQLDAAEVPPDRENYPFEHCTPGRWWQLEQGHDFTGSPGIAQMAAYKYAQRRGWSVRTRRNERRGTLDLCFLEPEPTNEVQVTR